MFAKFAGADGSAARRISIAGVLATAMLGLSACGTQIAAQHTAAVAVAKRWDPAKSAAAKSGAVKPAAAKEVLAKTGPQPIAYTAGMALISNGTNVIRLGSRTVTFPTTVTDAAWSPDGTRIAFIDADGNVAIASPDGTNLIALTVAAPGVTRANPTWFDNLVLFTETDAKGVSRMETVTAAGTATQAEQLLYSGDGGIDGAEVDAGNSSPSGAADMARQMQGTGQVAYQHQGSDGPEVWIIDFGQRESDGFKLAEGSDPALSPDGSEVAFVDGKGQVEVIPAYVTTGKPTATQVTFSAADPTNLAWSPDGSRIAFSTVSGIESVAAKIPAHATANAPTQLSSTPGTVTFLPSFKNEIDQFTGTDPVALSIAASQDRWPTEAQFDYTQDPAPAGGAVIGSSTGLAGDLALLPNVYGGGPLLLTNGSTLDPRVTAELKRIFGTVTPDQAPTVYLLGGTDAISSSVETALQNLGYQTRRVTSATVDPLSGQGADPYRAMVAPLTRTVLVDSASPLDELIGTAYAGYYGAPVKQVSASGLAATSLTWLNLGAGAAADTALFGPASSFGGQFISTLVAADGVPLGCTVLTNPQNPVTS